MSKCPAEGGGLRSSRGSASKRCLVAVLMVSVLAVSCLVFINDSEDSSAANATEVRICIPGTDDEIIFNKTMDDPYGESNWSAHYDYASGTLTLNDSYSIDPNNPNYFNYDQIDDTTVGFTSLYANGDLTLILGGNNPTLAFTPNQSDTYATYGIYVTGNLTIINDENVPVDRSLRLYPGSSYTNSAGIYCAGSLTIQNNSSHSFTVDAKGGDSGYDSSYTGNDSNQTIGYRTYGIQAENGVSVGSNVTLNAAGGDVSFCTKKGVTCSLGILSGTYQTGNEGLTYYTSVYGKAIDIATGGKIVATGGSINVSSSDSANTGIYPTVSAGIGGGAMTVNGSEIDYDPDDPDTVAVKATGGSLTHINGVDGGSGGTSYGMWLVTLTVNGGNVVSDGGIANLSMNMKCESYGLRTNGEITVNSNGKLIANAGESWRESFGIYARGLDEEDRSIIVNGGYVEGNADFVVSRGGYFGASTGIYATRILYADGGTVIGRGGVSIDERLTPIGIDASAVSLSNGASVTGYGGDCKSTYAATIYDVGSGGSVKDSIGIRLTETSHSVGEGSVLAGIGGAMIAGSGTGSLGGASYGILFSNSGTVSITGSGTVNATGGTVPYNPVDHDLYPGYNLESIGMHSRGALTISGIAVNATGGTVCTGNNFAKYCGSVSRGLDTESDLVLTNGATVNATGGVNEKYSTNVEQKADYNDSYGAYVNGSISVSASVLNATAGSASRMVGIIVNGSITLTNDATVRVVSDSTIRNGLVNNLSDLQGNAYGVAILNSDESADIVVTAGTIRCEAGVTVKSTNSGNTLGAAHIAYGSSPSSVSTTTESMEFSSLSHNEFFLARSAQYTVTFDANGGSGTMDPVSAIGKYKLPSCYLSAFTNPGYTLVGWIVGSPSGDEYGAYDQVIILSDTVVYAKWAAVPTYDVSFTNEGGLTLSVKIGDADARALTDGEITAGKITAIPEDTEVKFTAASITGYDLFYQANDGEVTALGTGYQFTVSGACSIAFTKAPHKYAATFNLAGGTVASTPFGWAGSDGVYTKDFDYGTPKATIISDFGAYTKVGHTKGTETVSVDTMGVDGMTITATWTPTMYNVTLVLGEGGHLAHTPEGWMYHEALYYESFAYGTPYADIIASLTYGGEPIGPEKTGYTFTGWNPDSGTLGAAPATLTAVYTVNKYTIRFVNYNGTELQSGQVDYGATPSYTGATPTRPSDAQYDYTFAGWNTAIVSVVGDATYTATFDSAVRSYTIRFVNYNGTELQSGSVAYGSTPVYSGATPEKDADDYFTYTFAEWDPAIVEVTGAATYTATFDSARIPYTISFATTEGGSGSMANVVVDSGDYVLPANGFTPATGKVFEGWAYGSASGQVYLANAHCDIHENVTFYAKWSDHQHTLVSIPAVPASCTESGLTEGFRCSECGQIIVAQVTVDALGHDHVAVVTEPTCTTGGYTTHTCSRCGDSYVDDEVPALGHSWGEWQITRAPTCTQAGEKTRTCAHDGTHTETESIPVIDHDYVAVVTAPTCTEKGFTTHTCSMCGDSYVDTYVDELGHTWASAEYTWSADGKTCTVIVICGTDNHRQTVPDVAVTSSVKTAATTSSMGVTAYAVNGTYQGFAYSSTKDVSDIPALEAAPTVKEGTSTYENEVAENVETAVTNTFSTAKDAGGEVELSVPTTAAGSMTIAFDNAAVNAIGGNEVRLQATVKENVAEIADAALVIEVTLSGATFSDGKAKVTVPFSQSVPEGKIVKVYFINGDVREDMNATFADGKVVFETNHFSTYAIFFEDEPSSSGSSDGGFPIWIVFVLIAAAAVAAVGTFFVVKKIKA